MQRKSLKTTYCNIDFTGVLAGGTSKGHVAVWKYNPTRSDDPWDLQAPCEVDGDVQCIEVFTPHFYVKLVCMKLIVKNIYAIYYFLL